MRFVGTLCLWTLLSAASVHAQDDGCGCGCGDGDEVEITIDGGAEESGDLGIRADPFEETIKPKHEENRPKPIEVGKWRPPALTKVARVRHEELLAQRARTPDDAGIRYRLAEFYLEHKWFKQCEAEYLACSQRDPDSIRPWEGLLRLYAMESKDPGGEQIRQGGFVFVNRQRGQGKNDWLTDTERHMRVLRAHREIIKRRPDDVARRRVFAELLRKERLLDELVAQYRAICSRIPDAAGARYDLAEALIKKYVQARRTKWKQSEDGGTEGPPPAGPWDKTRDEAIALLQENLRDAPDHARSALRFVRLIAERSGRKATARIKELERRGAFHLAIRKELADVPYRQDTWRMLRDLIGPKVANGLWDDVFTPVWYRDQQKNAWRNAGRIYYRRWIVVYFPHAQTRDRLPVIARLGRRADREAAGILASFLWHFRDWRQAGGRAQATQDSIDARTVEEAAVKAITGLGTVAFPLADRFLRQADTPARRRRAIGILAGLDDKRAARPLVDALKWDREKQYSLGVAAALERLGDPVAIAALVEAAFDVRRPLERRVESAAALAAFRDPRSIEALGRLRKEKGFEVVAGYGLYRLVGDESALKGVEEALLAPNTSRIAFDYLRKCQGDSVRDSFLQALREGPAEMRPKMLAELRRRGWDKVRSEVVTILLGLAKQPDADDFILKELGAIGGKKVATTLLDLAGKTKSEEEWSRLARALARTGDPRAIRYFNKMRILERNAKRRKLAVKYHELAARSARKQ